jgi:hypothetical protein
MQNWLNGFELAYYIAFIILTFVLAIMALKTYFLQAKKITQIYCKCIEIDENIYLEIFNYGNSIAKNIFVRIQENEYGKIEYLKPNEVHKICIGLAIHTLGANYVCLDVLGENVKKINVTITMNGITQMHEIDLSIFEKFFSAQVADNSVTEISREIEKLSRVIERKK